MNETQFKAGDRVRVVDPGKGNSVEAGDTGTVAFIEPDDYGDTLVNVRWDKGGNWSVYAWRLEYEVSYTSTAAPAEVHAALDELWLAERRLLAATEKNAAAHKQRDEAIAEHGKARHERDAKQASLTALLRK